MALTSTPAPPEALDEAELEPSGRSHTPGMPEVVVDEWVRSSPAGSLTDDQLSARILERERRRAALDAEQAADVAMWDARRAWASDGSASPAAWLAPRAQLTGPAARQRMKVCRWLEGAPAVRGALADGRLSWSKVEVFARIVVGEVLLARFPFDEAMLVGRACTLSVEHTTRFLRHWASLIDPDLDDGDEQRRQERRTVYLSEGWLGMGDLAGNVSPELLLVFGTQLESIMDELYQDEARGDVPVRTTPQRRHDALLELCRRAAAWDPQQHQQAHPLLLVLLRWEAITKARAARHADPGSADGGSHHGWGDDGWHGTSAVRASCVQGGAGPGSERPDGDDLVCSAGSSAPGAGEPPPPPGTAPPSPGAAPGRGQPRPGGGAGPPTDEPLAAGMWHPGPVFRANAVATEGDGPEITAETARRWACDAGIARILVGPDGEILDHGRTKRIFTAPQRRAILARYGDRCAWLDCDRPAGWLQIHHLAEWERDAGPTDLTNGVPFCSSHHHAVHEGGFTVTRGPAGELAFFRPDGTPLHPQPTTAMWRAGRPQP